jgi:thiosulfate dehydrogenase
MLESNQNPDELIKAIHKLLGLIGFAVPVLFLASLLLICKPNFSSWFDHKHITKSKEQDKTKKDTSTFWTAADTRLITDNKEKELLKYGKELITHTAKYIGPKGSVLQITNGMNCQNCHLEAGTKAWGNNYGAVFATYPKYRARSGEIEDIYKRINDCVERSLNGKALPIKSKEIQAIKFYIEYIGKDVKKGKKPKGSGIFDLKFLDRPIDALKGKVLFIAKCKSCHQADGQGLLANDKIEYQYPPLWGKNSYNSGAGLYRMSRFAGYIKYNMPQGATFKNPQLSDEEAWDIAAFVNSQNRPTKDLSKDWPKIGEKPVDHPFGPYADHFTEHQHKYGPFKPIADEKKSHLKI